MMDRIGDGFRGTGALPYWSVVKVEHILYGFVIVSSRFKMIREANVHAAASCGVVPCGSSRNLLASPVKVSRGFTQPSASRLRCTWMYFINSSRSRSEGSRDVASKNARSVRLDSSCFASLRMRIAMAWADSTKIGSLSPVNAAKGVLDRTRRAQAKSPLGASNALRTGSGIDRFRNMYSARRYRSGPWAGFQYPG